MPDVLILTGPTGAGKTAVAEALGDRYDRVAHIQIEVLRRFITPTGFVPSTRRGAARDRQYALARRNASALARNFLAERFGAIIEDAMWPDSLALYLEELTLAGFPIHVVQLLPSLEACQAREAQRRRSRRLSAAVARDYEEYAATARALTVATIDSTRLSVQETADRVQALTTAGESLVSAPADGHVPGG
jgi:chloramphenicol 3-O-phosphotransferase